MKEQQQNQEELPDSVVLAIIITLILGTIGYFVYGQWQLLSERDALAKEVSAQKVAERMAKEREALRAVSEGHKKLEDLDKEKAASETKPGAEANEDTGTRFDKSGGK